MQIQLCSNHDPRGSGGATIRKTIFKCIYTAKMQLTGPLRPHDATEGLNDSTPFFHFCNYLPFEGGLALNLNNLEFP